MAALPYASYVEANVKPDWNAAAGETSEILNKPVTITTSQANAITSNTNALATKESVLTFANLANPAGNFTEGLYRAEGSNTVIYTSPNLTSYAPKDSPTFSGTVSIGGGLISNSIVSVGTTWVDVPNTQPRGAYLILARSEDDNESALVACCCRRQ